MAGEPFLRPDWPAPDCVRALTTLRDGAGLSLPPFDRFNLGLHSGDDPDTVRANRDELVRHAALLGMPHWLKQVHGTTIAIEPDFLQHDDEPEADAAIARTAGRVLAILSADCLPVLLCSRDGRVVGAAHAGWRGLAAGVLERTIEAMQAAPDTLMAWLGPAAGQQAYEVGEEVHAAFVDADTRNRDAFVATRAGHWLCDLYALARRRLADAGVTNVHGGGLCTISDAQRFYSYRRDGQTGRMASLIWIASETGEILR